MASSIDVSKFLANPVTSLEDLEENKDLMKTKMELFITELQAKIINALVEAEGTREFLTVDKWSRATGGGGITSIIEGGTVIERGGVNVSVVYGQLSADAVQQMRARKKQMSSEGTYRFFAAGISSVIHPRNPNVPTVHFNYRYFEMEHSSGEKMAWFGGGTDLTPYFLVEEDVQHFHRTLKDACDKSDDGYYPRFKEWCDDYFNVKHRGERRGVGGIFFDDLDIDDGNVEKLFAHVQSCGNAVIPCYIPLLQKHKNDDYSSDDREWQLLRRGRYVEFNLVYDRGTKFGLYTPEARIESILMSLPTYAKWQYMHSPEEGSRAQELMEVLRTPKEWI